MKKFFQRIQPVALRIGREWPLFFGLAAIVSLGWLPANVPTPGNWLAKEYGGFVYEKLDLRTLQRHQEPEEEK